MSKPTLYVIVCNSEICEEVTIHCYLIGFHSIYLDSSVKITIKTLQVTITCVRCKFIYLESDNGLQSRTKFVELRTNKTNHKLYKTSRVLWLYTA